MKITIIILIAILTLAANIQLTYSASQGEKAASESSQDKYMETEDQFINNDNKWEVFNTTMATALIEDGKYFIENKSMGGELFILHHADFPLGREFILETSIKPVKLSDNYAYGFVIGASDASNSYVFQVFSDRMYSVRKFESGDAQEMTGGKIRSRSFKPDSFNSFKIEKMGGRMRFYINNYFLDEVTEISLFGKRIGFFVEGKSEIAIDYTRSQIWFD